MKPLVLLSWNVNGIRAISKKGFLTWLKKAKPDILAIQETKAHPEQLDEKLGSPKGYYAFFNSAEKKGYSGVAIYSKQKPKNVATKTGIKILDAEGRFQRADYDSFVLLNIYFPNGGMSDDRLAYKLRFYNAFLKYLIKLKKSKKNIILCGDVNTAHNEIDLARPKENETTTGFLPEERAWIDKLITVNFIDAFRVFNTESGHYSYWDYKSRARDRNVGWRIDYFFIAKPLLPRLKKAFILKDVMGSDHCPVGITISS